MAWLGSGTCVGWEGKQYPWAAPEPLPSPLNSVNPPCPLGSSLSFFTGLNVGAAGCGWNEEVVGKPVLTAVDSQWDVGVPQDGSTPRPL